MNSNRLRVIIADDEPPARRRIASVVQRLADVAIVAQCGNGREAVDAIREHHPDLVFLDIQMPDLNGFEVIDEIGADQAPAVVFVTAHDEFALPAFEVDAVDYLLKPFESHRLLDAIDRARVRLQARDPGNGAKWTAPRTEPAHWLARIPVRTGDRIRILDVNDVEYFEAEGNYVRVHTPERSYLIRESMQGIQARLDPAAFMRIHRGTIVQLDCVQELEPLFQGEYRIRLRSGASVTSSRRHRSTLQAALNISG